MWYPEYRIRREDISGFAVDNAGWGQVLIDLKKLGLGNGNQTIYAITISTHYWNSKPVTLYFDEIQFLPAYTLTTQNAVTETPVLYDDKTCKDGENGDGSSSATATSVSLFMTLLVTLIML